MKFHLRLLFVLFILTNYLNAQNVLDSYCFPEVVPNNGTFKIHLEVINGIFDSISIEKSNGSNYWPNNILLNGQTFNKIALFDDGTNGDEVANDHIYTRDGLSYTFSAIIPLSNIKLFRNELLKFYNNGTVDSSFNYDLNTPVACYDPLQVTVPNVIVLNDTIQYTDKTINLKFPAKLGESPFPNTEYWKNSGIFNDLFCDDFTFLILNTTNNPVSSTSTSGSFGPSSNFTQGIGKNISDLGMPFLGIIRNHWISPSHFIAQHEMLHKWAAQQDLYGDTSDGEGVSGFGHWAWIDMDKSGLRGFTSFEFSSYNLINVDTFEVYRGIFNGATEWSNLELYMAGLMPIDSVDFPITYFTNVEVLNTLTSNPVIIKADIETVTQSEWLSVVGPRIPVNGPNVYEVVQLVLSDELLEPGQLAYFDKSIDLITSTNNEPNSITPYEATNGLLTVRSKIIPPIREYRNLDIYSDTTFEARNLIVLDSVAVHSPASLKLFSDSLNFEKQSMINLGSELQTEQGCDN